MNSEKILSVINKLEKLESSWTCLIDEKDSKGKVMGTRQTHLRSVPQNTGKLLKSIILLTDAKKILELGCSGGYSALWMSMGAIETGGHIYTTEILKDKIKFARQNFKEAGVEGVITLEEGDVFDTLKKLNLNELDLVFFDADKDHYIDYYNYVLPLLKKGGIIIADNMISHASDLKKFVELLSKDERVSFEIISLDSGIFIAKKN